MRLLFQADEQNDYGIVLGDGRCSASTVYEIPRTVPIDPRPASNAYPYDLEEYENMGIDKKAVDVGGLEDG